MESSDELETVWEVTILRGAIDSMMHVMNHRGRQKDAAVMRMLFDALKACKEEDMSKSGMAYAWRRQVSRIGAECDKEAITVPAPSWYVHLWRLMSGAMDDYTVGQSILIERLILMIMYYERNLLKARQFAVDLVMACSLTYSWFAQVLDHRAVFITLLLASAKDSSSVVYRVPRELWHVIFCCTMHDLRKLNKNSKGFS